MKHTKQAQINFVQRQQPKAVPPSSLHVLARAVATLTSLSLGVYPVAGYAGDFIPTGETNTQVTRATGGAQIVTGAAPRGPMNTSFNRFISGDVDASGLVFNNNVVAGQSQLAGALAGNPNYKGVAASQIIAEMTGKLASTIGGSVEVSGQAAQVVIVNPNGISVGGTSVFINTPSAILAVGRVHQTDGVVDYLDTSAAEAAATLHVDGKLSNQDGALALLSPTISVTAASVIQAKGNLDVVTGFNTFGSSVVAGGTTFNIISPQIMSVIDGAPSTVAIDANLLGAMQADRVNIVATRAGAGVNMTGNVTADKSIFVKSRRGNLTLSGTHAVTSKAADGEAPNLALYLAGASTAPGSITATDLTVSSHDGILLQASDKLNLNKTKLSADAVSTGIDADGHARTAIVALLAGGQTTATASTLTADGILVNSGDSLSLASTTMLGTSFAGVSASKGGTTLSDVNMTGDSLVVAAEAGDLIVKGKSTFNAKANGAEFDALAGKINLGGTATFNGDLHTHALLGSTTLNGVKVAGNILVNEPVEGVGPPQGDVSLTGVSATGSVVLEGASFHLTKVSAGQDIAANAVAGVGVANTLSVASGSVSLISSGDLSIDSLTVPGDITVISKNGRTSTGLLHAKHDLVFYTNAADPIYLMQGYANNLFGDNKLQIGTAGNIILGQFSTPGDLVLATDKDVLVGAFLGAQSGQSGTTSVRNLQISAKGRYSQANNALNASGDIQIATGGNFNLYPMSSVGSIYAKGDITLAIGGDMNIDGVVNWVDTGGSNYTYNTPSTITAGRNLTIAQAKNLNMRGSNLQAARNISITADKVNLNSYQLFRATTVNAGWVYENLRAGEVVSAGGDITITSPGSIGIIDSNVRAGKNFVINVTKESDLTVTGSNVSAAGNGNLSAGTGGITLNATQNTTSAWYGRDLVINEINVSNVGSTVSAAQNLTLTSAGAVNILGSTVIAGQALVIAAAKDVTLSSVADSTWFYDKVTTSTGSSSCSWFCIASRKSSTTTSTTIAAQSTTQVGSSAIGGTSASITAGNNVTSTGNNTIASGGNVNITAGNNISTVQANNTTSMDVQATYNSSVDNTFLWFIHPKVSLVQGSAHVTGESSTAQTTAIVSTGGDVTLNAGNAVSMQGGSVTAAGDVAITGQSVTQTAATSSSKSSADIHLGGFNFSLSLFSAPKDQTGSDFSAFLNQVNHAVAQAGANQAAANALSQTSAVANIALPPSTGLLQFGLSAVSGNMSASTATTTETPVTVAGQNVTITATNGDVSLQASQITANPGSATITATKDVTVTPVTNTSTATSSVDAAQLAVNGGVGLDIGSLSVNVNANAGVSLYGKQTADSSSTQSGGSITAGQDVTVAAGGATSLTGTTISAGNNASVTGVSGVNLAATTSTSNSSSVESKLTVDATVGANIGLISAGSVDVDATVKGNLAASSLATTTQQGVSITAGNNATVNSSTGSVAAAGTTVSAGNNASVTAAGSVTATPTTNTTVASGANATLNADAHIGVGLNSGLGILVGVLSGESLIDSAITGVTATANVDVAGSASTSATSTQNGGSVTAGNTATIAGSSVATVGTSISAPTVVVSGTNGVVLGSATNTSTSAGLSLSASAKNIDLLSGDIPLMVGGSVGANYKLTPEGTTVTGTQSATVVSSQGSTTLQGATVTAPTVDVSGATGVKVGAATAVTANASGSLSGPVNIDISNITASVGDISLGLGGGITVSADNVKIGADVGITANLGGGLTAGATVSGSGSTVSATGTTNVSSSGGAVGVTGSTIAAGNDVAITADKGVSITPSSTITAGANAGLSINASIPSTVGVSIDNVTVGVASKDISTTASGVNINLSAPVTANVGINGSGSLALGNTASSVSAGNNVTITTPGKVELANTTVTAGNTVAVSGSGISATAPVGGSVSGTLNANVLVGANVDVAINSAGGRLDLGQAPSGQVGLVLTSAGATSLGLSVGATVPVTAQVSGQLDSLTQSGGAISGGQAVNLTSSGTNTTLQGTTVSSGGTVSITAPHTVALDATTSLVNGTTTPTPTTIHAAGDITVNGGSTVVGQAPTIASSAGDVKITGNTAVIATSTTKSVSTGSTTVNGSVDLTVNAGLNAGGGGLAAPVSVTLNDVAAGVTVVQGALTQTTQATPTISGNNVTINSGGLVSLTAPTITAQQSVAINAPVVVTPQPVLVNTTGAGTTVTASVDLGNPIATIGATLNVPANAPLSLTSLIAKWLSPKLRPKLSISTAPNSTVSVKTNTAVGTKVSAPKVTVNGVASNI